MTRPQLVFVHGLANGPAARRVALDALMHSIENSPARGVFEGFHLAEWRSRGAWSTDITDLAHPDGVRAFEAVFDVAKVVHEAAKSGAPLVILGHSMGQVLSRLALEREAVWHKGEPWGAASLVTIGGPLGNPVLAAGLYTQAWSRRVERPSPVHWLDIWNREDPISADILLGHREPVGVSKSLEISVKGHPSVADPLAEHSSYLTSDAVWDAVADVASALLKGVGK